MATEAEVKDADEPEEVFQDWTFRQPPADELGEHGNYISWTGVSKRSGQSFTGKRWLVQVGTDMAWMMPTRSGQWKYWRKTPQSDPMDDREEKRRQVKEASTRFRGMYGDSHYGRVKTKRYQPAQTVHETPDVGARTVSRIRASSPIAERLSFGEGGDEKTREEALDPTRGRGRGGRGARDHREERDCREDTETIRLIRPGRTIETP